MKFPAFDYQRPATVHEAVALLAANPDAKVISGGQSLLPTMAFRLAAPSMLVDISAIGALTGVEITPAGVVLGSRVRWVDIERDDSLRTAQPLLVEAIAHVAHYQIRNRGTVGGSIAHADPAAEMPGIAVACDAQILVAGPRGQRTVAAAEFFVGALSTVLEADEIITQIRLPAWTPARKWAFEEFSRRKGDFALAGVAVHYDAAPGGLVTDAHVGVIGACHAPHRVPEVEAILNGRRMSPDLIAAAAAALPSALDAPGDIHASAAYRKSLAGTLLKRALVRASAR